jgi:nondiscriminating glutamyl-tRNA synthetase
MSDEDFLKFAKPFVKVNLDFTKFADLVILTFKNYITYADELNQLITTNFIDKDYSILEEVLKNNEITTEEFNLCIQTFKDVLGDYCEITVDNTNEIITKTKEKSGLKGKKLFIPIRFLAIAKEHGPEMNKILPIVGKTNLLNIKI